MFAALNDAIRVPERWKIWAIETRSVPPSRDWSMFGSQAVPMSAPPVATTWTLLMFGPPSSSVTSRPSVLVVALVERGVVAGELRLGDPLQLELDRRQRGERGAAAAAGRTTGRDQQDARARMAGRHLPRQSHDRSLLLTRAVGAVPTVRDVLSQPHDGRPPARSSSGHLAGGVPGHHEPLERDGREVQHDPEPQASTIAAHADRVADCGRSRA